MSYIRCLSNPEALYIAATSEGVKIFYDPSKSAHIIPADVWHGLFDKLDRNGFDEADEVGEYVEHAGFRVYDLINVAAAGQESEWRVRMQFADWKLDMWDVTFAYIAANANRKVPNPPPWEVLTGVYFARIIKYKLDSLWWRYFTQDGRSYHRKV